MRLIVDTHCWLWMQSEPERFSEETTRLLMEEETELLLSAASSWEIAIKYALGKLALPVPPVEYVPSRMRRTRTRPLAIEHRHALHVSTLPRHHRDPFDRLIVAQAQVEGLPVMTADRQLRAYDVEVVSPR